MVFRKILTRSIVFFNKHPRGFTLIELAITMLIISMLAVFMLPVFRPFMEKSALEQAAAQLAADLRYIKQQSISSDGKTLYRILITPEQNSYSILANTKVVTVRNLEEIYKGKVNILYFRGNNNELAFNIFGRASKCGTVALGNNFGNQLYVITSVNIGRVRVDNKLPDSPEKPQ